MHGAAHPSGMEFTQSASVTSGTSRTETVTMTLRDMIIRGDFPSGLHLQELSLAEKLGVSRTPIREALASLAREGLLEPGPRRGFKVRTFSIEEIVDAYEVRATLEGAVCRLLAERGLAEDQIRQARDLLDAGDQLLERGRFSRLEHEPWSNINSSFHHLLARASRNSLLDTFIQQTNNVPLAGPRDMHWYRIDDENLIAAQQANRDHHEILNAIIRRQSSRAEARMREHIYLSRDLVQARFRQQTVGFDATALMRVSQQDLTR